jgi:hypothetical protein
MIRTGNSRLPPEISEFVNKEALFDNGQVVYRPGKPILLKAESAGL